jgi:hypothetical protein
MFVYFNTAGFTHRREEVFLFTDSERDMHCKCEITTGVIMWSSGMTQVKIW